MCHLHFWKQSKLCIRFISRHICRCHRLLVEWVLLKATRGNYDHRQLTNVGVQGDLQQNLGILEEGYGAGGGRLGSGGNGRQSTSRCATGGASITGG